GGTCVVSQPVFPLAATNLGASVSNTASTNPPGMGTATHRRSIRASAVIARVLVLLLRRAADCAPSQSCRSPPARGSVSHLGRHPTNEEARVSIGSLLPPNSNGSLVVR